VRSMETAETAMETDGDGSGGTSPSRRGARIETSVPRNLSSTAAVLWNYSGKNADCFWVFCREALYRRRGGVRSETRRPHHRWAWTGARLRPLVVSLAPGHPLSHLWSSRSFGKNRRFSFCFVQLREYFMYNFSETQK
jgi:hypothetical protein